MLIVPICILILFYTLAMSVADICLLGYLGMADLCDYHQQVMLDAT